MNDAAAACQPGGPPGIPCVLPLPDGLDPVEAWRRLSHLPRVLFLDSADRGSPQSRYSFVAADPFLWVAAAHDEAAAAWDRLADVAGRYRTPAVAGLPPFQGGVAGLLGYELGRAFEPTPRARFDDLPTPPLAMGVYDAVVAFDLEAGRGWVISQGFPETAPQPRRERAEARAARFAELLRRPMPDPPPENGSRGPAVAPADLAPQHAVHVAGMTSNLSPADYRQAVRHAVEAIHAGELFQVNLAQRLLAPAAASSIDLYLRLRHRNPAPYAAYFDLGEAQVLSASPECFLTVRDRWAETRPIKGTRARWLRPEADLFAGDALRASPKDRAENIMIVDLMRNDFSRACEADTVTVAQLCGLENYAYVQHLVSVVRGRLADDCTHFDLCRVCFPAGSITGAPKIRAMEIVAQLEPTLRGPYCGSLAYLGFDGRMDASVLIRTITARGGWWQLPVGGGIVAESDPDDEYRETWHKARGLLAALRQ